MKIVDANTVLRYLLNDNQNQAEIATNYLENYEVYIPFEVIAEIVYVLEKVYKAEREDISGKLTGLFNYPNIDSNDNIVAIEAFKIYSSKKFDFVDSILCAYKVIRGFEIITFDKKIIKFKVLNES